MNKPTDNASIEFEYWWNSRVKDDDSFCRAAWQAWQARGKYDAAHPSPPSAWISVRDRLPEENVSVLVACEGGVYVATWTPVPGCAPMWVPVYKGILTPTHWQPLPAPPPPADPFDAWWESLPVTDSTSRLVEGVSVGCARAKAIWNAALASHATP